MTIYEALNWIKEANYTPCGYIIFNENKPEGQMKGKALKTIFEAAKNNELIPVELFNQIKKERDKAIKSLDEQMNPEKGAEYLSKKRVLEKLQHTEPYYGKDNSKERFRYIQWLADKNAISEIQSIRFYKENEQ